MCTSEIADLNAALTNVMQINQYFGGGQNNTAREIASSVNGGSGNFAIGEFDCVDAQWD